MPASQSGLASVALAYDGKWAVLMAGIGSGYGVPLVLGLPPYWGAPLDQARVPGPESAPLELSKEDWFLLAPL